MKKKKSPIKDAKKKKRPRITNVAGTREYINHDELVKFLFKPPTEAE